MATTKKKTTKKKSTKASTKPAAPKRPKRGINREKIGEEREKLDTGGGGDIWAPDPGDTIVYVHPPCRMDDTHALTEGVPYVPIEVHYNVGGSNGPMAASLDKEANGIMTHPAVRAQLKKRGVRIKKGECPIKVWLAEEANEVEEDRAKRQTKWAWGVTPIAYKAPKARKYSPIAPQPAILMAGITVHDGFMEVLDEIGDITDYDAGVYLKINKKGNKMKTKYSVIADPKTLRSPVKLDQDFVDMIEEAMKPDGDCDLFKFAGNLFKSTEDVKKILASGGSVDVDDDDDEDDDDDFDDDEDDEDEGDEDEDEDDAEDDEDEDAEDDEDEGDEDEDDAEDEGDEDEGDEDDEDEDEGDEDDADDDEGDEDEDEDEDDAEDEGEAEDDDDGLDELDAELDALTTKSTKKAAKKKTTKKKVVKKKAPPKPAPAAKKKTSKKKKTTKRSSK